MNSRLRSWIVVLAVGGLTLPMLWLLAGVQTQTHSLDAWLPKTSSERLLYDRYTSLFGADDVVLVSWPGCTVNDSRLPAFCERIEQLEKQQLEERRTDRSTLFSEVVSGRESLVRLTDGPLAVSLRSAHLRLRGTIVGRDGDTTGAILYLSAEGQEDRQAAVELIRRAADEVPNLGREEIRCGGNAFLAVVVDEQTKFSMLFAIPACLVALSIGWYCFRTIRLTFIAFVTAGLASGFSLALVQILEQKLNGLLILMPTLVLVLTMSGAVHLVNYYLAAIRKQNNDLAVSQALRHGWRPCALAALTTCFGIGSLAISQIFAVRLFGIFSALSFVMATFLLLLFLPAMLRIWPASKSWMEKLRTHTDKKIETTSILIGFLNQRKVLLLFMLLALVVFTIVGLRRVETMLQLERFFPQSSRISKDLAWLDEHFVPAANVQIVIGMSDTSDDWIAKQANNLLLVQKRIAQHDQIESTFSIQNVVGPIPKGYSLRQTIARAIANQELVDSKGDLIKQQLFAESEGWRYWKIQATLKHDDNSEVDYSTLNHNLKSLAENRLAKIQGLGAETEVFVSGMSSVFDQAQTQLFNDLIRSFSLAFLLICPATILVVRSVRIGLVAMIPNVLPVVLVYSLLGWIGVGMDVGTILTASVGLGIAVDDTLHFLEWYRNAPEESPDNKAAVCYAFNRCARPMIQTTLICGLGLLMFAPSEFIPVRQFSIVIAVLLLAALAADLILLPLLLLTPLGRAKRDSDRH